MQMRGNLHRYRVSSSGKRNRMLQGTFMPSYRPVLKFAAYGLLYTSCVSRVTVKKLTVDMSLLLQNVSFSVCATENPN